MEPSIIDLIMINKNEFFFFYFPFTPSFLYFLPIHCITMIDSQCTFHYPSILETVIFV